jgi:hypothetical protein
MNVEIVYKGARRGFGLRYSGPERTFLVIAAIAITAVIGVVGAILRKTLL